MKTYTFINALPSIYQKEPNAAPCSFRFKPVRIAGIDFLVLAGRDVFIDIDGKACSRKAGIPGENTYCIADGNLLFLAARATPEKMESALTHYLKDPFFCVARQVAEWKQAYSESLKA
jgi:hypothetical protein